MPAYFYHLLFELSRRPGQATSPLTEDTAFTGIQNLDIFSSDLPAHRSGSWISYVAPKRPSRESKRSLSSYKNERKDRCSSALTSEAKPDTDCLSPSCPPTSTADSGDERKQPCEPHKDWRHDALSIESVNMELKRPSEDIASDHESSQAQVGASQQSLAGLALKGKYVASNTTSTDIGYGVVHLYRDHEPALESINKSGDKPRSEPTVSSSSADHDADVDKECSTLCILAVPSYMTPSDLFGWLGEQTREQVSHFRLIRTPRSNKYMVLMKFREPKSAEQWQRAWNGKLFNSMEPENCHVVFVRSIQFQSEEANRDPSNFPDMTNDPFTPTPRTTAATNGQDTSSSTLDPAARSGSALSTKPAPPPTPSLLELPTCPVCLERMDEITGLATIFCQHVFHCACLEKWRGSGCPVCRYTQNELGSRGASDKSLKNECSTCGAADNLWICLICGHVGCGRYDEAHAFAHYEHTSHTFAMDIDTQRIWDYAGDEWVHRLIQNKSDGKLVELPSSTRDTQATTPVGKLEEMSLEYTHMLTSQLDSQRMYFEEQVDRAVDKAAKATAAAEQAAENAIRAASQLNALRQSNSAFTNETLPSMERDRERAQRRAERFESTARKLEAEFKESKIINESLMDRITHLEKQLDDSTAKNMDLQEQNRDLSFFISGMEKLKNQGEEVQEGTVSVADAPAKDGKRKKKKNKPKKPAPMPPSTESHDRDGTPADACQKMFGGEG